MSSPKQPTINNSPVSSAATPASTCSAWTRSATSRWIRAARSCCSKSSPPGTSEPRWPARQTPRSPNGATPSPTPGWPLPSSTGSPSKPTSSKPAPAATGSAPAATRKEPPTPKRPQGGAKSGQHSGAKSSCHSQTVVQTCVVHLIRASMRFISYNDRKAVAAALRPIYTAATESAAAQELDIFEGSNWGKRYPATVRVWRDAWQRFIPFLEFPPAVRKIIYTTNSSESLNYQLRKIIKNRGHFPNDDAVVKLLWLAIRDIEDKRARQRA